MRLRWGRDGICPGWSFFQAPKLGQESGAGRGSLLSARGARVGATGASGAITECLASTCRGLGVTGLGKGGSIGRGSGARPGRQDLSLNLSHRPCFGKTCRPAFGQLSAASVPCAPRAAPASPTRGRPALLGVCSWARPGVAKRVLDGGGRNRGWWPPPALGRIPGQRWSSWGLGEGCKSLEFKR